jgi:hypothetical protein
MKAQLSLITLALTSASTFAQLSDQAGFSGEVSINAGYSSSSSNFDTDSDKTITDNTQSASSESGFMALPLGNIAYTFGSNLNHQFYAGTAREDIAVGTLALEVGYKHKLANSTVIDLSLLPTLMSGETWADPFIENSTRQVTDESGIAYRLQVKNIAGSNFSLDTAYASKDIDNEQSGSGLSTAEQQLLRRDASTIYVKGDYRFLLNRTTFIQPSLNYTQSEADGDANSYTALGGEISYFKLLDQHQFALTAGYTNRSFDASTPVYAKTRDENELSFFAAYQYQDFLGWQDWSLISFAGYSQKEANIDFYDEEQIIMSVGMNYQF